MGRTKRPLRRRTHSVFSAGQGRLWQSCRLPRQECFRHAVPPFIRQDHCAIDRDQTALSQLAAAELKAGERVAGRYRIDALLGVGGMGVVYRAHDEQLGIDVALKLLRPELASRPEAFERFRQELLLARKVSSPHVVRIHDLVADGERWLISMDLVAGRSLEQQLDAHGALPEDQALAIARQIAQGLAAAHASGIVHRDLKPANILLRDDGHACISDFGVARSTGAERRTGTGILVGTPDYVSPEQARGGEVGPRSDLYALGLILYEMLSGRRAFDGTTPSESLAQRQLRAPMPLRQLRPEIAPWIDRLTTRLLDPSPLRRLRDADAVVAAIDAQSVGRARPRMRTLAAATLAVAIAGGAWWVQENNWALRVQNAAVNPQPLPVDLVALPLQAPEKDADIARAYSALIGASLLAGDTALVDRRRVEAALGRLGYDSAAAIEHPQRVLAEFGAKRLLGGELKRDNGRISITLRLYGDDANKPPRVVQTASVSVAAMPPALRGALAQLQLLDAQGDLGTVLPSSEPALSAFGRGLAAAKDSAALAAYDEAIKLEPRFVAAWWQRLQVARRLLPSQAVAAMTASARDALRGVRGRDAERVQALISLLEGNAEAAVERFTPLAAADSHDHHTRLLLAEALEAAGDRKASDAELDKLTASDPQNADAWLLRGQNAIRAGEAQRAVDEYLIRARLIYMRLRNERGRADALNALGLGFDLLGQPKQAVDYFTQAAEIRTSLGDIRGAAGSRRNLAWILAVSGDYAAAESELARARALALPFDDPGLLADIAADFGLIAEERGDFNAALPYFREALSRREATGEALGVAGAANNLGFALLQTGDFSDAQAYLKQAERTYGAAEDRFGLVHNLQSLAAVDAAFGDYVQARKRLDRAMQLATEVNLAEERAVLHLDLANLARNQGRLGEALAQARRALILFEQGDDARGLAQARLTIANVYLDFESPDAAAQALQPFANAAPGNREQQALLAIRHGAIALARGQARSALAHVDAALGHAQAANSVPVLIEARLLRVQALHAAGDAKAADDELARADTALQSYPAFALRYERAIVAMRVQPPAAALAIYRAASKEFRLQTQFARLHLLHRAGAAAFLAVGDTQSAARTQAQAETARNALRASMSEPVASREDPDSPQEAAR